MSTPVPTSSQNLPVNDLAAAYQPRRVWAAGLSIALNLVFAAAWLARPLAWGMYLRIERWCDNAHVQICVAPLYVLIYFSLYSAINYPLELWCGYVEERQFGLAKDGIRAWTRDWLVGVVQHGLLFVVGSCCLLALQNRFPHHATAYMTGLLLGLFLLTAYFAADVRPIGLFAFEKPDTATRQRLSNLAGDVNLPPAVIYSASALRDFSGGLVGLGRRQVLFISRSTLAAASDHVLRFVLRHEAGHRRYHHPLIATLVGWLWVAAGLELSHRVIPLVSRHNVWGLPPYIAWLGLTLSAWMALGEPLLAYLGRRMEYQADRFYLRHGGSREEMGLALAELSDRNLARTEGLRRRQRFLHPLPSITARLFAAQEFERLHRSSEA